MTVLVAGILSQACLGTMYAWSVFGENLRAAYGLSAAQTELIFGLAIGTFAMVTIATGRLVYRVGPRVMTLTSAALFALAFVGASLSRGRYPSLLVFLGPLLGVGIAFGYVCPLTTAVAWFPRHKGLVTGLAVAGFGGGALISAAVARGLFASGMGVLPVFAVTGIAGGVLIALAGLFLRLPPHGSPSRLPRILSHDRPFHRTAVFWALCGAMFLGTVGGLVVIGTVLSMSREFGLESYGGLAIGLLTLGNAGGRLIWGAIMDRLGSRTIVVSFLVMLAGFVLLNLGPGNPPIYLAGLLVTGLQFGASLVVFATYTERYYGAGAIGRVYPWVFACYGLAAVVGPWLAGMAYDATGSYRPMVMVLAALPAAGALLSLAGIRSVHAQRPRETT